MKSTITKDKETEEWIIKIYSNKFDKKSVDKMHRLLDESITSIKDIKVLIKQSLKNPKFKEAVQQLGTVAFLDKM